MDTDLIFCPDVENNSYRPPDAAQHYIRWDDAVMDIIFYY